MLHRIDGTVNADEELASASAAAEEEVAGPVRQGMEGDIDITTGTAIPSMKGVITVEEEVLDENGAPTGTYNVDVNGEAAVMSEDEMRSAYDEFKARVDEERAVAAERGRSEREAARSEEEYRQQVGVGDDVTFVRDGKRISDRAVMDYDEDSLIVDVEDGARTRSYNVRREEIVAPGTAVEEEETPAVDDNAVQEDDVQTDTGNAQAQAQEETEAPVTPEETGAAETAAPAHADNGTTTSSPSTDAVVGGQETHAPAQAPAPSVQAEQQSPANGNVVTPAADTATVQRESGNAHTNGTAPAQAPASAQDIVSDRNTPMPINEDTGEPDYARATPERTREFLYNESGLEADEADAYVGNNAEQAREELEKAKESKPKMEKGKTLTQFLSEKAAWQQQMDEAQRNVDYWEGVKNAGQETAPGIAPVQDATNGAAHVDAGTDAQNMGQTAAPAAGEQRASLRRKSYVMGEQAAVLAKAEEETNVEPTEAQKKAGNYKKGHVKIDGFDVSIEQPKGSVRRGTDASGRQWEQTMNNTYGYIRGTEGVDGDHIDVLLSDDPSHGDVFVVDQVNKDGTFDEHKVMYGFADEESARQAYLSNYEEGWTGLGAITHVTKDEFRKWVNSSRRKTKPFAEYKNVKVEGAPTLSQDGDKVDDQDMDAAPSGESTQETPTLTHQEAISLISQMEEQAHVAPEIELTIENWDALFGEEGKVSTPIGEVKMGENQFTKLMRQGRNGKLGMIKPTLENPDVIIEDASEAKDGDLAERNSSYIFVKAFKKADGSRYYYFTSITVSKGGREVVVSSQEKSRNRLLRLMTEGKILWRTPKDATTASVEQQGLDYAQPSETETATKGSGVTPQSTDVYPSADKVSESSVPDKNNGEKVSEYQQEGAGNVENNAPEASLRNGRKAGNAKNDILNDEQKKMLDSIGRALGIRVELVDGLGANGECDPAEWFRVACIYTWVNVNLNLDD